MATATIPKPSQPSASELAARILDLALELAVAHRANNQRAIRCATSQLVDACHGLAPGSLGPPQLVAPVEALRRDVNADGCPSSSTAPGTSTSSAGGSARSTPRAKEGPVADRPHRLDLAEVRATLIEDFLRLAEAEIKVLPGSSYANLAMALDEIEAVRSTLDDWDWQGLADDVPSDADWGSTLRSALRDVARLHHWTKEPDRG